MKNHLCSLGCAIGGFIIPHFTAFAETAEPNSTTAPAAISAPLKTSGQSASKQKECEDEWRANREAMMKHDMDEDRYVEQCSTADDVPTIPPGPKAAPSAAPK